MLVLVGVVAIDVRTAGVTASVDTGLETIEPDVAVIKVVPVAKEEATPVLLIVATAVFDEDQVANVVRSRGVESASTPEAVNCSEVPLAILAVDGEVEMVATGDVVSVTEPMIPLKVPEIVVAPGAPTAVARPEAVTPAMPGFDDVQVA